MNRIFIKILIGIVFILPYTLVCSGNTVSSGISVQPSSLYINMYETMYLKIDLDASFQNPYDPEDISVDVIISSPDGEKIILPCFYISGEPGKSRWEARYTAMQAGKHTFRVQSVSKNNTSITDNFYLNVADSGNDGFLRLNKNSFYTFSFDSEKRFRGIGLNVCWENKTEWKHPFETYFDEMAKNGANYARVWMCPWNLPLEWTRVLDYNLLTDEFQDWNKLSYHSPGLSISNGKTAYTEDDTNRIIIQPNDKESIIYNIKDIRNFKIKMFYENELNHNGIKCSYSSDNMTFHPAELEYSLLVNTTGNWKRNFFAYIPTFPDGTDYLKIEFDNPGTTIHLANIEIKNGEPTDILDAPGLGRYYEKTSLRLDSILQYAEAKGIYIMLTFDYHGIFKPKLDRWGSNDEWRRNPYNIDNGGPCQTPVDFFTNAEAKKIYKKRLRYIVARWGYSPNIGSWELWNEIDNVMENQNVPAEAIVEWHREMAQYLKEIDPYKHLINTSISHKDIPELWKIKDIDFGHHHNYGHLKNNYTSILNYISQTNKPEVIGEFAIGSRGPGKDYPAELYEDWVHDGIWKGIFAPTPVLPLTWWWEFHLYLNHYFHFKPAATFSDILLKYPNLQGIQIDSANSNIETLGLKADDKFYLWINNYRKEDVNDLELTIPGILNKEYGIKYFNTWTGEFSEEMRITPQNEKIVLKNLKLNSGKDIAILIKPI